MWLRRAAGIGALAALGLGSAIGRGDEGHVAPPETPGAGLLEFLGSVDRLAEVNPDYLKEADPARAGKPGPSRAVKAGQSPPPPPVSSATGVKE